VAREVKEETSLVIDDIKYVGSQSWPFPSNIMVGFTARYVSGEVAYADGELSAGEFFGIDNLPVLPTLPSLARVMIDDWVKTIKEKK
jgi:NAD+ diphosphatase